jgi:hypothetical protein
VPQIWEVEYTDQFGEWFAELTDAQQLAIANKIDELKEGGPNLGRPTVDTIVSSKLSNLKELRCTRKGYLRVLFVFDPRRTAILLLGGDKTGEWESWYKTAIPEAEALYTQYLEELRSEGLL